MMNMTAYSSKEVLFTSLIESNSDFHAFAQLPIMANASPEHLQLIFSCMTLKRYQEGDEIYQAGTDSVGEMFLILAGKAKVKNESGHEYAALRQGEVFGLFSFLDNTRQHSATVSVERELRVLTLERPHFDLISLEDPKVGSQLMHFMFRLLSEKALRLETEYAQMHSFAFGGSQSSGKR